MSWFTENYEKAALGAAIVSSACLTLAGISKLNSVNEYFSNTARGVGNNDSSILKADSVSRASASLEIKRDWSIKEYDGLPADLFTGVSLYVNKNIPDKSVYLIKGDPIHPPIPNNWWLDHKIDLGFGDSPLRDADKDGFSNIEEFRSKTDPCDPEKYPALITKLQYLKDESVKWILRPGYETDGAFTFKYASSEGSNKVSATSPVSPGTLFFDKGVSQGRFKLISSEKRKELNKKIGTEIEITVVKVEDQKPNKKGIVYEIPANFRESDSNQFVNYDRTAILSLNALGLSEKQFRVEENSEFALPPESEEKAYKIIKITPDLITVEYRDIQGKVTFIDIPQTK